MIRLADFCYRRRRYVLGVWVLVFVGVMVAGGALPAEHRANYQTPGAESGDAYELLNERFPSRGGDAIKLVFAGAIDDPAAKAQVDAVIAQAAARPHVTGVTARTRRRGPPSRRPTARWPTPRSTSTRPSTS